MCAGLEQQENNEESRSQTKRKWKLPLTRDLVEYAVKEPKPERLKEKKPERSVPSNGNRLDSRPPEHLSKGVHKSKKPSKLRKDLLKAKAENEASEEGDQRKDESEAGTSEWDVRVLNFLRRLKSFQDAMHKNSAPEKARSRRRLIFGSHEALKHLQAGNVRLVILSRDTDPLLIDGTVKSPTMDLVEECKNLDVRLFRASTRAKLGRALKGRPGVSVVAILNYDGAEDAFKELLAMKEAEIVENELLEEDGSLDELRANAEELAFNRCSLSLGSTSAALRVKNPSLSRGFFSDQSEDMGEVVVRPTTRHTATVCHYVVTNAVQMIFLHGLGDQGDGWASVFEQECRLPHVKVICPSAESRRVTLNLGMHMPAWFDLYGLSPNTQEDDEGIEIATALVHSIIDREVNEGISSEKIILGGFSMGGALALYAGLTYPSKLGAIVGLSSFLIQRQKLPGAHTANLSTPIFLGHGFDDFLVPLSYGRLSEEKIKTFNQNVQLHVYRGLAHSSSDQELNDLKAFVNEKIPAV